MKSNCERMYRVLGTNLKMTGASLENSYIKAQSTLIMKPKQDYKG